MARKSWANIRNQATSQRQMKAMIAQVTAIPRDLIEKKYFAAMTSIAWDARKLIQEIILESHTETGKERVRSGRGSEAGRYETGAMYNAVWANVRKAGKGGMSYSAQVGWLAGTPGYAVFQEQGTKSGIKGMRALETASQYIEDELRKLARGGRIYSRDTRWD